MFEITFSKILLILAGLIAVTRGEHLFEGLLQRRAKPIHWKWSKDLMDSVKTPDIQRRRRFLPEASMEKWWRTMSPRKDERLSAVTSKETSPVEGTYFRRSRFHSPKLQRLTETAVRQKEDLIVVNSSLTVRDETNFRKDRLSPFDNLDTLTLPVDPFDKDNHVLVAAHYLSPTEKTSYFGGQSFQDSFGGIEAIPQQQGVENEDYSSLKTESNDGHDVDSELLRELIIHERHKPSKYEHQSASQRLKESGRSGNDFRQSNDKPMSAVEYIVPYVENVEPYVEYADNISVSDGSSAVMSNVEYVTPVVEFVEPQIEYVSPEFNTSLEPEPFASDGDPLIAEDETVFDEDLLPNENKYSLERYENDGIKSETGATRFQIVGLRREQIRVRRNHRKQVGVPDEDYPTLEALPVVQFYCGDYKPGYYVDITTRCQVFHICHENGQRSSFLCPVGTVFNQEYLVCDWWYNVDCETSSRYYNSESLQAYSTNNEKQRIFSQTQSAVREPVTVKKESTSRNPILSKSSVYYSDNTYENKRSGENNPRPKLTNLSQKAINYPVGYAILLREYMKNSLTTNNKVRDQNSFYQDRREYGDKKSDKFISQKPKTIERYGESVANSPATTNYSSISKYLQSNPRYRGKYKPHTSLSSISSRHKNHEYKQSANEDRSSKPYISKHYQPSAFVNHNRSSNIYVDSSYGKHLTLDKRPPSFGNEKLRSAFTNRKPTGSQDVSRTRENIQASPKHFHKSIDAKTIEANRYRFIIDPSEAIKPATGKIYTNVDQHIKNNNSAIKFRHAESTIKHIKPQINKAAFTINGENGKSPKNPSVEDGSRVKYYSSVSYSRDNEGSHSVPGVTKTADFSISRRGYGERLSIKSRSVPSIYEKVPNETRKAYLLEGPKEYYPSATEKPKRETKSKDINQSKSNTNRSNNTYGSVLLGSESMFNFAKVNETTNVLGKDVIKKSKNETSAVFYLHSNKLKREKQKISVSVQVEKKVVALKYNKNIPSDKNVSSVANDKTIHKLYHSNESSEFIVKPRFSSFYIDTTKLNDTHSLKEDVKLENIIEDFESQNVTKINNTHGGFIVVKVPRIVVNNTSGSFSMKSNPMAMNVSHAQQLNQTVPNIS